MTPQEMIQRLDRLPAALERTTKAALDASLLLIEADARALAPRDVGRLGGSISSRASGSFPNLEGRVGPSVAYGAPVEFGRRIGARMPPVDALVPWVRRHWQPAIVGQQRVLPQFESEVGWRSTNRRTAGKNVTAKQLRSRAWGLARAISIRGIRQRPYLRPSYTRNSAKIATLFASTGQSVVATLHGEQL